MSHLHARLKPFHMLVFLVDFITELERNVTAAS
jgi:hypothetical protein